MLRLLSLTDLLEPLSCKTGLVTGLFCFLDLFLTQCRIHAINREIGDARVMIAMKA